MDSDNDEAAAMASLMGFSSFGGPDRPSKKRRYNPGADTVVGSISQTERATTGSNSTPLGARKQAEGGNADEIALEDEDEDKQQDNEEGDRPAESLLGPPPASLPQRLAVGVPGPSDEGQGPHRGMRNERWYEGYYDSLSNRNPWEKLEKSLGLQPRGAWMPQQEKPTAEDTAT